MHRARHEPPAKGAHARSTRKVFEIYHDQYLIENVMHWLKGDLELAPVFLKDRGRLAALAQVYVIALIVYALIQRDARSALAKRETTIAANIGFTASPTTEVVFRIFEGITAERGFREIVFRQLTTAQAHGYRVLGLRVLDGKSVRVITPRVPAPADRGYYRPQPKRARKCSEASCRSVKCRGSTPCPT